MHAISPVASKATRQRRYPRAPQQQVKAFSPNGVLLFGLRIHAQNSNGFVVVGDAFPAEPYAIRLRKDIAPFQALSSRDQGPCLSKGRSAGSPVPGSTVSFLACPSRGAVRSTT
ncbi:hypothetical protein [Noviherbaspirillum sp. ST9]|uniref:hypothetical protein n=1 Tax=Noviherbaspirillum sp. ST9 TaxID=3401606 RepID=UPI003B58A23F